MGARKPVSAQGRTSTWAHFLAHTCAGDRWQPGMYRARMSASPDTEQETKSHTCIILHSKNYMFAAPSTS